jgi:hypothetical protein
MGWVDKQDIERRCGVVVIIKECGKQTNFDRIKAMSVEELAKLLCYCSDCGNGRCYGDKLCTYSDGACNGLVKWLESEVQEDE